MPSSSASALFRVVPFTVAPKRRPVKALLTPPSTRQPTADDCRALLEAFIRERPRDVAVLAAWLAQVLIT